MSNKLRILIPIDFSEPCRLALDQAIAWAKRMPCELHLAHVVEAAFGHAAGVVHELDNLTRIAELESDVLGPIQSHVAVGHPAIELVRLAYRHRIDLIIMGSHGRSGLRGLLLGSIAASVVRHADCPVLCINANGVNGSTARATDQSILCPIDFSETSHRAMAVAADLAHRLGVGLRLLHVEAPPVAALVEPVLGPGVMAACAADGQLALQTWKSEVERRTAHVTATTVVGTPATAIADSASKHHCQLIVMGTHGRTGLAHILMGSVAERVLRTAPCPVLTVHPHDGSTDALVQAAQC